MKIHFYGGFPGKNLSLENGKVMRRKVAKGDWSVVLHERLLLLDEE
jgi:hypothetical protein